MAFITASFRHPVSSGRSGWGGIASLLAALALAGCASVGGIGEPAEMAAPGSFATEQSFSAPPGGWPTDKIWDRYNDPQLSGLVMEALRSAPTVAQAAARVRQAEALAAQARGNAAPTLSGTASATEAKQSYNNGIPTEFVPRGYNDSGRVTLDFGYEFDFWGRNRSAIAAAVSETRAAQADMAAARLILAASIADAYGQLARLFAERDVAADALRVRARSVALVRQRVANGLDTLADQRQAEAQVPAAREALAAVDEAIALTRNSLAALAGAGPDRGLAIERPARQPLRRFALPANIPAELLGRRPDIVAARWRAEAATQRVGVARADFYPNVNLNALIGFQALGVGNLFKSGSDIGSVGPAISLPILDGGRIRARYAGTRAEADLAVASYNQTLVTALRQVADAAASERALAARLADARQGVATSADAYRLAKLRYEGQLSNYFNVLEAEDRLILARRALAELEARAFTLDVALMRALGGGFGSDPSEPSPTSGATP